jgi:hypothetical protein
VFRTDDLLQVFRNAVIPNINRPRSPSVPPSRRMLSVVLPYPKVPLINLPLPSDPTTPRLWSIPRPWWGAPGGDDAAWHTNPHFMDMSRQEHPAQHLRLSSLLGCIFSIASLIPSSPSCSLHFLLSLFNVLSLHTCSIDELSQFSSQFERHRCGLRLPWISSLERGGPRPACLPQGTRTSVLL